jgi:hypothetical protein
MRTRDIWHYHAMKSIDRQMVGRLAPLIQVDQKIRDTAMGLLANAPHATGVELV